ncbi:MAG: ABC transporter substrate-binding protein [Desulfobacteraceae bacterium]
MKQVRYIVAFLLIFSASLAFAGESPGPEEAVKTSVNTILTTLKNDTLSLEQKQEKVVTIMDRMFDFSLIGKLCLGRANWSRFDPGQKSEYTDLFADFFKEFYSDKIELFNNEKIVFSPGTISGKKAQIPSHLISNGEKTAMIYRLYRSNSGWKVYDVEVEGISIVKSYRSQFSRVLEDGTPETLLKKLREKEIEGATGN